MASMWTSTHPLFDWCQSLSLCWCRLKMKCPSLFFFKLDSKKARRDAKAQEESKLRRSSKSVSFVAQHFHGKVFVRWSDSKLSVSLFPLCPHSWQYCAWSVDIRIGVKNPIETSLKQSCSLITCMINIELINAAHSFQPFTWTDFPEACIFKISNRSCPWMSSLSHPAGLRQSTAFCMQTLTGVQSSNLATKTESCCVSILLNLCPTVSSCHVWIQFHLSGNTLHMSFGRCLHPKQLHLMLHQCTVLLIVYYISLNDRANWQAKLI